MRDYGHGRFDRTGDKVMRSFPPHDKLRPPAFAAAALPFRAFQDTLVEITKFPLTSTPSDKGDPRVFNPMSLQPRGRYPPNDASRYSAIVEIRYERHRREPRDLEQKRIRALSSVPMPLKERRCFMMFAINRRQVTSPSWWSDLNVSFGLDVAPAASPGTNTSGADAR
jgi:hypothetical protein